MLVTACIVAPCVYTGLSLLGLVPMTVPIFVAWLAWLQLVHGSAAVALWRRRESLSTRVKATALYWGGLAFWYWLPAPVYYLLTMNIDELQLKWTAFAFFWEVPVVGGALRARRPAPVPAARAARRAGAGPRVPRGHALPDRRGRPAVRVRAGRLHDRRVAAARVRLAAAHRAGQERLARPGDLAAAGGLLPPGARPRAGAGARAPRPRGGPRQPGRPHGGRPDPGREPGRRRQRLRAHQPVRAAGLPGHGARERGHHPAAEPAPARRRARDRAAPGGLHRVGRGRPPAAPARRRVAAGGRLLAGDAPGGGGRRRDGRARHAGRAEGRRRRGRAPPRRPVGGRDPPHRRLWPAAVRRAAARPSRAAAC